MKIARTPYSPYSHSIYITLPQCDAVPNSLVLVIPKILLGSQAPEKVLVHADPGLQPW